MTLTRTTRVAVADGIHHCEVDGEVVLLNSGTGLYFGLDRVGTQIWTLALQRQSLGDIVDALVAEFDVTAEIAWRDLERIVGELGSHGLVNVSPS